MLNGVCFPLLSDSVSTLTEYHRRSTSTSSPTSPSFKPSTLRLMQSCVSSSAFAPSQLTQNLADSHFRPGLLISTTPFSTPCNPVSRFRLTLFAPLATCGQSVFASHPFSHRAAVPPHASQGLNGLNPQTSELLKHPMPSSHSESFSRPAILLLLVPAPPSHAQKTSRRKLARSSFVEETRLCFASRRSRYGNAKVEEQARLAGLDNEPWEKEWRRENCESS